MKYSNATNYALHVVQYLYKSDSEESFTVNDLASVQNVSPSYLSKILTKLVKAGILEAVTGVNGGYRINRQRESISMLDVIHAIEGTQSMFTCNPDHGENCTIYKTMLEAEKKMEDYLKSISIDDIS